MNHYQRLQVDFKASPEIIKTAYRALLKNAQIHPDLGGDEAQTKLINLAYDILSDPVQRIQYNRELQLTEPYRVVRTPPEYILFCNTCGKANRVSDQALIPQAKCGACHRKLAPQGGRPAAAGHERPFKLGMYLFEKGLLDRSLREFQTAARLKPGNATYRYWLGRCYYQKRIYEKAVLEFKIAVSLRNQSFQFQFWLGQSNYKAGELGAAANAFENAALLRSDHAPTFHRLGTLYYHLRQYDQAVRAFTRAIHLDPQGLQSHRWLGLSYYGKKEFAGARQAFANLLRISPGDSFAGKYMQLLADAPE